MHLNDLSIYTLQFLLEYVSIKDASCLSITTLEYNKIIKEHYIGTLERIRCSLKSWKITFPNAIYINIRERYNITGEDFKYLSKVKILNMPLCTQKTITDYSFQHLINVRELNLQGACGHWIGGHHFTDTLFDYLTNLEKLYIDNNHVITNDGINKLIKIKHLTIHNCSNISNDGLSNLISIKKLDIYNLYNLTDDAFKKLINLEELTSKK